MCVTSNHVKLSNTKIFKSILFFQNDTLLPDKTQNTEHRTQNTKHKTKNTKFVNFCVLCDVFCILSPHNEQGTRNKEQGTSKEHTRRPVYHSIYKTKIEVSLVRKQINLRNVICL